MIPLVHLTECPEPPAYMPDDRVVRLEITRINRRGTAATRYPEISTEAVPGLTPDELAPSASYRMF